MYSRDKDIVSKSKEILSRQLDLKQVKSAKNYVCTTDLKHWAFGKSIINKNGTVAQKELKREGFVDILKLEDASLKEVYIEAFLKWASKDKYYAIKQKFKEDQANGKRFMLLVHNSLLGKVQSEAISNQIKNLKEYNDGARKQIILEIGYRNQALIIKAKETLGVTCEVCTFNFGETYGSHGKGFIEMHHLDPIALGERRSTIADLKPVCANCHRMLHRGDKVLSIAELKRIIAKAKK